MDEYITSKDNKVSFQIICLQHLERILRISCTEFHGGFWTTRITGEYKEKVYIPSTTKEYIQSVESLHDVLLPHFDDKMKKASEELTEMIDTSESEVARDKEIKDKPYVLTQRKLKLIRKLFQELNLLLERLDYLGGTEYIEE